MSIRELDIVSREFKNPRDVTLIRKDANLYQSTIQKEAASFLKEIEKTAEKEKSSNVILIALIHKPPVIKK
jgi:hypothetical protein